MQQALTFSESSGLRFVEDHTIPKPKEGEALLKILRAGICSTGYVDGFDGILGHECVARVIECSARPELVGARVTTEINCRCDAYEHPTNPIFTRNHAPNRVVLGIIAKDGVLAEFATVPVENLHVVPESVTDLEAAFAEPLAAACRIVEQQVIGHGDKVAVIGDGKLGLLVAQVLVLQGARAPTHFGHHQRKLDMVQGTSKAIVSVESAKTYAGAFDVCIEASGSSGGIELALAVTRPMGTVVLKSTCSLVDKNMPQWSAIANDIVVNEKRLLGSRCGPFPPALGLLEHEDSMRNLVNAMVDGTFSLKDGLAAFEAAKSKGALKIQIVMTHESSPDV